MCETKKFKGPELGKDRESAGVKVTHSRGVAFVWAKFPAPEPQSLQVRKPPGDLMRHKVDIGILLLLCDIQRAHKAPRGFRWFTAPRTMSESVELF